jgi:hypothetical protein
MPRCLLDDWLPNGLTPASPVACAAASDVPPQAPQARTPSAPAPAASPSCHGQLPHHRRRARPAPAARRSPLLPTMAPARCSRETRRGISLSCVTLDAAHCHPSSQHSSQSSRRHPPHAAGSGEACRGQLPAALAGSRARRQLLGSCGMALKLANSWTRAQAAARRAMASLRRGREAAARAAASGGGAARKELTTLTQRTRLLPPPPPPRGRATRARLPPSGACGCSGRAWRLSRFWCTSSSWRSCNRACLLRSSAGGAPTRRVGVMAPPPAAQPPAEAAHPGGAGGRPLHHQRSQQQQHQQQHQRARQQLPQLRTQRVPPPPAAAAMVVAAPLLGMP